MVSVRLPLAPPRARFWRIYVLVAALATAISIVGFWPSYFGPLFSGKADTLPIIHLHAAVFAGWMALVILQATLAAPGKKALHIKIGQYEFCSCGVRRSTSA